MKRLDESQREIIFQCLVIIGACLGMVVGAFGVLWIYGLIERLRFGAAGNPGDELIEMIAVVTGTLVGAILGGFLAHRLIVSSLNRK